MADEQTQTQETAPQETATVTNEPVTDDALSSAWDAMQTGQTEEVTETTQETEVQTQEAETQAEVTGEQEPAETTETEQPEEPTNNAERSRLGRRLAETEKKLDDALVRLEALANGNVATPPRVQQQTTAIPFTKQGVDKYVNDIVLREVAAAVERGELPETPYTAAEIAQVNSFSSDVRDSVKAQVLAEGQLNYEKTYIGTLRAPTLKGDAPDDLHAEVLAELQNVNSPFNLRRHDNPTIDAQLNYLEAKNSILQKRLAEKKPASVFKGKQTALPTGTSVSTRTATAVETMPELDAASLDFIKRTGMSDESVKNALKGELPLGMRGMGR